MCVVYVFLKPFLTFIQSVEGKGIKDIVLGGKMLFNCWRSSNCYTVNIL